MYILLPYVSHYNDQGVTRSPSDHSSCFNISFISLEISGDKGRKETKFVKTLGGPGCKSGHDRKLMLICFSLEWLREVRVTERVVAWSTLVGH